MLTPRSLYLQHDDAGGLSCVVSSTTPVERYIGVMRALQQRAGCPPRRVLFNSFPVLVATDAGRLSTARVSGAPQSQREEHEPIILNEAHIALFLQRGDHVMLQVTKGPDYRRKYVAVEADLGAQLIVSDLPIASLKEPPALLDFDAARLLAIAQERELTQVEQFFAAMAMPAIWRSHGGGPVPVILNPTAADIEECGHFAREFTRPEHKLAALVAIAPSWAAAPAAREIAPTLDPDVPRATRQMRPRA